MNHDGEELLSLSMTLTLQCLVYQCCSWILVGLLGYNLHRTLSEEVHALVGLGEAYLLDAVDWMDAGLGHVLLADLVEVASPWILPF
jgi:hypothetical protein